MTERKVSVDRNGKAILSNTRLPDEHYQPGDTAEVVFEGAVGTIRPAKRCPGLGPDACDGSCALTEDERDAVDASLKETP